jgi:hypothetical protein
MLTSARLGALMFATAADANRASPHARSAGGLVTCAPPERPSLASRRDSLEEVTAQLDEGVSLFDDFDALGDHRDAHVLEEGSHRPSKLSLHRTLVNVTHERHVELYELGFEALGAMPP